LKGARSSLNFKRTIWVAVVKGGEAKVVKVATTVTKDFTATIIEVVMVIIVAMMAEVEVATVEDLEVANVVAMITDR
jgi:cytochrome b involved in lipid metabolism